MMTEAALPWSQYSAYREVTAYPQRTTEERFSLAQLHVAARKADVLFRGWPFIFYSERDVQVGNSGISVAKDVTELRHHRYFERWELLQSGLFFHRALMEEATVPRWQQGGGYLDLVHTIYHVGEAIGSLWRLYEALDVDDDEPVLIEIRYTGMLGRSVQALDGVRAPLYTPRPCAVEEVVRQRVLSLREWRSSDAEISTSVVSEIFERGGWQMPNQGLIRSITDEFLAKPRD